MNFVVRFMYLSFCLVYNSEWSYQQNCTEPYFIRNSACKECGLNSDATVLHNKCICRDGYYRYLEETNVYEKNCFLMPSEPQHLISKSVTNTSISLEWQAPNKTDENLRTKYDITDKQCVNTKCRYIGWKLGHADTSYTLYNLKPFTKYVISICSYNDVTASLIPKHRRCMDDTLTVTTRDGVPGTLDIKEFRFQKLDKTLHISFGKPSHFGSKNITIKLICDNISPITKTYTQTKMATVNYITMDEPCVKLLPCTLEVSNEIGVGHSVKKILNLNCSAEKSISTEVIIAIVLVLLLVSITVIGAWVFIKWRKEQNKKEQRWLLQLERANNAHDSIFEPMRPRNIYVDNLDVDRAIENAFLNTTVMINDEVPDYVQAPINYDYEFPRDDLHIKKRLGEGNFAIVYKAEARNICGHVGLSTVAVKVLKDKADQKDRDDFVEELELMKFLRPHANVVRLLGCCTGKGQIAMIVEYLLSGDLLGYLRCSKSDPSNYALSFLKEKDFINMAYDIANGMSHLAESDVVHRDLACRNVLVGHNRVCKIADMGLSRILDDTGIYMVEKSAKLPIKWLAPESVFHGKSSIKSDIWSFGITLWEIITIGGSPYPGYKSKDVSQLLRECYRMQKPEHCSDKLYALVISCWEELPRDRPTFQKVRDQIQTFLSEDEEYMHFDMYHDDVYVSFDNVDDDLAITDLQEEASGITTSLC